MRRCWFISRSRCTWPILPLYCRRNLCSSSGSTGRRCGPFPSPGALSSSPGPGGLSSIMDLFVLTHGALTLAGAYHVRRILKRDAVPISPGLPAPGVAVDSDRHRHGCWVSGRRARRGLVGQRRPGRGRLPAACSCRQMAVARGGGRRLRQGRAVDARARATGESARAGRGGRRSRMVGERARAASCCPSPRPRARIGPDRRGGETIGCSHRRR